MSILVLSGLGAVATPAEKEIFSKTTSVEFSNIKLTEDKTETTIILDNANSYLISEGKPVLPSHTKTFTFPSGTVIKNVECTAKNIQTKNIQKELKQSPQAHTTSQIQKTKEIKSVKLNSPYPENWFDYKVGYGLIGQERSVILELEFYPVKYLPLQKQIKWANEVDIKIDYEQVEKVEFKGDQTEYVIITPSEFSSTLSSLVSHKNNRGLTTKLVTLQEIYDGTYFQVQGRDNPEKIKYFIKNAIENWDTMFVLLVGGEDEFPVRLTHVYVDYGDGDAEIFATDLYYADIFGAGNVFSSWDTNENDLFGEYDWEGETDDVDLHPDVYLSRLAVTSPGELSGIIDKITTYESNNAYTQEWFTNLVVTGGDTSPGDSEEILEGEYTNQAVIDIMTGFIPTKCWASEGTLSTKSNLNTAINDGAGFVEFAGHGNPQLWATHPFDNPDIWIPIGDYKNSHVASLNNGDKLPIVMTGACSVAKFIDRDDCFTWSFVLNPNGGGIASVGPSALSWGYDTSYVIEALGGKMQIELFSAYKINGAYTFGEMWARAISNYISAGMDGGDHKTIEECQPFGDPTLLIAAESTPPEKPNTPDGPANGKTGETQTYTSSTTDADMDKLYYLFDWGDDTYSEWLGPYNSGEEVEATHSWSAKGEYEIRVLARDEHGKTSLWSDPLAISMPKAKSLDFSSLDTLVKRFPILQKILEKII